MRFLPWKVLARLMAAFFVGVILGAISLNLILGNHLDTSELEIERLTAELEEQSTQIATLQETIAKQEEWTVTEIQVEVSFKDAKQSDELVTLEIEKTVKELLKSARGRKVSTLDPQMLLNIVQGRTITASNTEFTIDVQSLLISEKLIIYVEAEEKTKPVDGKSRQDHQ